MANPKSGSRSVSGTEAENYGSNSEIIMVCKLLSCHFVPCVQLIVLSIRGSGDK